MGDRARARRSFFVCTLASLAIASSGGACGSFSDSPDISEGGTGTETEGGTEGSAIPIGEGGDPPLGPIPPGTFYVFVSSVTHNAAFGAVNHGLDGADAWCKMLADESALSLPKDAGADSAADAGDDADSDGGDAGPPPPPRADLGDRKWHAWLSTTALNARDHVVPGGRLPLYLLPDGTTAFVAGAHFGKEATQSILSNAINIDELGVPHPMDGVWTGTNNNGTFWGPADGDCSHWTSTASQASLIGGTATAAHWSDGNTAMCGTALHLYCFESF